ncbi:MAG: hypothetical protein H7330_12245 [Hymenobacteraceae bacterium]|nr:hypothetical protein [Hymenobacteraceae bacterium]
MLLTNCVSARRYANLQADHQTQAAACERAAQATELALSQQQVRVLLIRTRFRLQTTELDTTRTQLTTERATRAALEADYNQPPPVPVATPEETPRNPAELKINRELLRRQINLLEGSVRASRDSLARQTQRLQRATTSVRTLEQTVADRDRTIGDLRQRLSAALTKRGVNVQFADGKVEITTPDPATLKSVLKRWWD